MALRKLVQFLKHSDGNLKKKTIRAGIWVGISTATLSSLSFVRSIILARLLTPEIFGLWAICMMYIRGIELMTETGFGTALIQKQDGFEEAKDTAFTLMVIRGILLTLISFICAPLIAVFFEQDIIQPLISFLALALLFSGFANMNTIQRQKELDFKPLVYLEQIHTLTNFILVVVLAYIYRDIWSVVLAHVASTLLYVIMTYIIIPGKPNFAFNKKIAWELFHYGKFITGLTIVVFITTQIDNAVIGKILGMEVLGFYALAYTLANLPATHMSKILSKILFPAYSKLQNDLPALQSALTKAIKFISLTTIPASFLFIILADELITVLYGDKWQPAADSLRILAIFGMLRAISSLNGYMYNAIGKPHIPFYFNLGKLIVIAIIIVPLTLEYGIEGTAIAITAPLFIQFFISLFVICRIIQAKYWIILMTVFKICIISTIMITAVHFMKTVVAGTTITGLILLLVTSAVLFVVLSISDIKEMVQMILSRKNQ
ncbi:MAG: lipopolysaccharide biosynthesis protein [Candidatus Thiodiazotropha sp.]